MLDCEVDEQVRRIDTPDRIARLKGSDPEGYRRHRHETKLFQPPPEEVVHLDTTTIGPRRTRRRSTRCSSDAGSGRVNGQRRGAPIRPSLPRRRTAPVAAKSGPPNWVSTPDRTISSNCAAAARSACSPRSTVCGRRLPDRGRTTRSPPGCPGKRLPRPLGTSAVRAVHLRLRRRPTEVRGRSGFRGGQLWPLGRSRWRNRHVAGIRRPAALETPPRYRDKTWMSLVIMMPPGWTLEPTRRAPGRGRGRR